MRALHFLVKKKEYLQQPRVRESRMGFSLRMKRTQYGLRLFA